MTRLMQVLPMLAGIFGDEPFTRQMVACSAHNQILQQIQCQDHLPCPFQRAAE
jgi:hypothetical protein